MPGQVVYMLIVVAYGKKKQVGNRLLKLKQVEDVHELYGQYDLICKIRGKNLPEIESLIASKIRTIKEIERTETLVVSDVPSM